MAAPRVGLVLGGGGLKGFAHIGVLRALARRGIEPDVIAGSSIGALIGTAYAAGVPVETLADRALALRRRDLFRINHVGMLLERMRSRSIYLEEPLRNLVESVVPTAHLHGFGRPVLVNTVDAEHGTQVVWGLPGLERVSAVDAVYASCALPGFFPPALVGGRICIDGGTMDNLPVAITAQLGVDVVIAVDVGSSDLTRAATVAEDGFTSIFMRAATIMMHRLQLHPITGWSGPPMLLIRPRIAHIPWFGFGHAADLISAGERAAEEALDSFDECRAARGGIFPKRRVTLSVDEAACVRCGTCVAMAPDVMTLDSRGIAVPRVTELIWSPADGDFVRQCPTRAIQAVDADAAPEATAPDDMAPELTATLGGYEDGVRTRTVERPKIRRR